MKRKEEDSHGWDLFQMKESAEEVEVEVEVEEEEEEEGEEENGGEEELEGEGEGEKRGWSDETRGSTRAE
jgi:hypothetical protein